MSTCNRRMNGCGMPVILAGALMSVLASSNGVGQAAWAADEAPADLVRAHLVADAAAIEPGGRFTLGVVMKIKPHWHTYWVNPGDFGNATTIRWQAPEGFNFGPIQWPLPKKITADGFTSYGYEDEVMLLVPASASAGLKPGDKVTLHAHVTWLCCHEECVEGSSEVSLTLPVAERSTPANANLFGAWRQRLPADRSDAVASVHQENARDGQPAPVLTVRWKAAPKHVDWLPVATEAIGIADVKVRHEGSLTEIRFKSKIYAPDKVPADGRVEGVLVFTDTQGRRLGISLAARVANPTK